MPDVPDEIKEKFAAITSRFLIDHPEVEVNDLEEYTLALIKLIDDFWMMDVTRQ